MATNSSNNNSTFSCTTPTFFFVVTVVGKDLMNRFDLHKQLLFVVFTLHFAISSIS
jgi:hypothetical protein